MMVGNVPLRYLVNKTLWSSGFMTLIILSMVLPVQAQVKQVEELQYPPLPELVIPEPERVVLENGMVVLLMEDHELPLISLSAYIRTGSRLEPPCYGRAGRRSNLVMNLTNF